MAGNADAEEYLKMRFEESLHIKVPLASEAAIPVATKLLTKQKELMEIEEEVEEQRKEYNIRMNKLAKRKKELRKKEEMFKDSLRSFEKFFLENTKKRTRANEKAIEDRLIQESKDKEYEKLKEDYVSLSKCISNGKIYLNKLKPAHDYLEEVVKASDQFQEVSDVIGFYDNLIVANQELIEKERQLQKSIDLLKQESFNYTAEKKNQILTFSNQLDELQTEYDITHSRYLRLESQLAEVKSANTKKTLNLGQAKMAIQNMFLLISEYQNLPLKEGDIFEKLQKIQEFIADWSVVVKEVKKQEELGSSQPLLSTTSM